MKLKSLFLASLAAMAMVSCSNEDDQIIGGSANANLEENARMQFSIAFPAASSTRANDDDQNGLATEQKVQSIQLILKYVDGSLAGYNKNITFSDIDNEFNKNNNVYTLKSEKAISAVAGNAVVYVCINGSADASKVSIEGAGAETITAANYSGLDALTDGIAKENKFLMTGKNNVEIKDKETVTAKVAVDRVAAKISERSKANLADFNHKTIFHKLDGTVDHTEELTAKTTLLEYSFLNINKTSYVFKQAAPYSSAIDGYFQYSAQNGSNLIDFNKEEFYKKSIETAGNEITYCMENTSDIPTYVVYKAKVEIGDQAAGTNFYCVKNGADDIIFYKNFAELASAYKEIIAVAGLDDTKSYDEFHAAGITKYTSGICYYVRPINTLVNGQNVASIYRNNHYILNVSKISGIGSAVVDPIEPVPATYMSLEVSVNPWTVQENNMELN